MQTINYATGRNYGMPQVLTITIESETTDDYGFTDVVATFSDASRNISGRVTLVTDTKGLGEAVLQAYDAGQYQTI
jgi:hypothetical protein